MLIKAIHTSSDIFINDHGLIYLDVSSDSMHFRDPQPTNYRISAHTWIAENKEIYINILWKVGYKWENLDKILIRT